MLCIFIHTRWHVSNRSSQWGHNGRDGVSNHHRRDCLLYRLFRRRSKKTSKFGVIRIWPVTGEFSTQMASNTENVAIWYRHHVIKIFMRDAYAHKRIVYSLTRKYYVWYIVCPFCSEFDLFEPHPQPTLIHYASAVKISFTCIEPILRHPRVFYYSWWMNLAACVTRFFWTNARWKDIAFIICILKFQGTSVSGIRWWRPYKM